jgi:hypothetical protein
MVEGPSRKDGSLGGSQMQSAFIGRERTACRKVMCLWRGFFHPGPVSPFFICGPNQAMELDLLQLV